MESAQEWPWLFSSKPPRHFYLLALPENLLTARAKSPRRSSVETSIAHAADGPPAASSGASLKELAAARILYILARHGNPPRGVRAMANVCAKARPKGRREGPADTREQALQQAQKLRMQAGPRRRSKHLAASALNRPISTSGADAIHLNHEF
jgi:hypothetical protein